MKVRKAVIPAAGFGTRFLPQTKAMPKEMLPIVDKPVIQIVVESLVEAGITDIIIVTGYHKRSIEDHFDTPSQELIENLRMGGAKKRHLLEQVEEIANLANFIYIRQKGPYGNGTPLLNVQDIVGDEPFIYTWSDDYIKAEPNEFQQLVDLHNKYGKTIVGCIQAEVEEDFERYGIAYGDEVEEGVIKMDNLVEKPGKEGAQGDYATVSSYLYTPDIFRYLNQARDNLKPEEELYWTDAVRLMMEDGVDVLAAKIKGGKYYDTGNKLGYLKAVIDAALEHPEISSSFKKYIQSV